VKHIVLHVCKTHSPLEHWNVESWG